MHHPIRALLLSLAVLGVPVMVAARVEPGQDPVARTQAAVDSLRRAADAAALPAALNQLAEAQFSAGQIARAVETWREAIRTATSVKDSATLSTAHQHLALRHWSANLYDSALTHLHAARSLRVALGDRVGLGRTLNTIGTTYYQEGYYQPALEAFLQALELRREEGDTRGVALVLANIGKIYHDWAQYDRALPILEEAVRAAEAWGEPSVTGYAVHTLGVVHTDLGNYAQARALLERSLALYTSPHARGTPSDSASGWSLNMMALGVLAMREGRSEEALEILGTTARAAEASGSVRGQARSLLHLGEAFRLMGQRERATDALERALGFARASSQRTTALAALAELAGIEEERGNTPAALRHLRAYHALRDSVFAQSTAAQMATLETRAELERQERENLGLRAAQAEQAAIIGRQRVVVGLGSVILVLAAILVGVLVQFNRRGKERTTLLARANADLETANRELRTALSEVRTLSGLIPICAHCKKVRDDQGYWESVESYITSRSEALFSHSICASCGPTLYGDLWEGAPPPQPGDAEGAPPVGDSGEVAIPGLPHH